MFFNSFGNGLAPARDPQRNQVDRTSDPGPSVTSCLAEVHFAYKLKSVLVRVVAEKPLGREWRVQSSQVPHVPSEQMVSSWKHELKLVRQDTKGAPPVYLLTEVVYRPCSV